MKVIALTKLFRQTPLAPRATFATMARMALNDQVAEELSIKKNKNPARLPSAAKNIKRDFLMMANKNVQRMGD